VLVWEARQIVPTPGFIPRPYRQFGTRPKLVQVGGSLVFTLLGKLGDLPDLPSGPPDGGVLAAARRAVKLATRTLRRPIAYLVGRLTPTVFPRLLRKFEETDAEQPDEAKRRPQCFEDFAWHGLPMDNEASDRLMPTEFTEIWVPLLCTARVMDILHREFGGGADARTAYRHTGTFAWELYAEMSSRFWLNAAYTTGAADDPWREGAFRVDIYWFERNTGDPTLTFFRQFWSLLRRHDIPFRLHWGKFLPDVMDDPWWAAEVADRYEMRDAFLAERARRDPDDLFLTDYWREHLGLTGTGGPVAPI
jgi:D-arabinono-1,4-lactone oxidase